MLAKPEDQDEETTKNDQQNDKSNEDIAKQIPTVTPDQDNLEPVPDVEEKK